MFLKLPTAIAVPILLLGLYSPMALPLDLTGLTPYNPNNVPLRAAAETLIEYQVYWNQILVQTQCYTANVITGDCSCSNGKARLLISHSGNSIGNGLWGQFEGYQCI